LDDGAAPPEMGGPYRIHRLRHTRRKRLDPAAGPEATKKTLETNRHEAPCGYGSVYLVFWMCSPPPGGRWSIPSSHGNAESPLKKPNPLFSRVRSGRPDLHPTLNPRMAGAAPPPLRLPPTPERRGPLGGTDYGGRILRGEGRTKWHRKLRGWNARTPGTAAKRGTTRRARTASIRGNRVQLRVPSPVIKHLGDLPDLKDPRSSQSPGRAGWAVDCAAPMDKSKTCPQVLGHSFRASRGTVPHTFHSPYGERTLDLVRE